MYCIMDWPCVGLIFWIQAVLKFYFDFLRNICYGREKNKSLSVLLQIGESPYTPNYPAGFTLGMLGFISFFIIIFFILNCLKKFKKRGDKKILVTELGIMPSAPPSESFSTLHHLFYLPSNYSIQLKSNSIESKAISNSTEPMSDSTRSSSNSIRSILDSNQPSSNSIRSRPDSIQSNLTFKI